MDQLSAPEAAHRAEGEPLFLAALEQVERIVPFLARRLGLSATETEDFASEVKVALLENDHDVLRRFAGRSSLRTYLTTVVHRLLLDHLRGLWGKWRPSAEATRLGPAAVRLEMLLYRDGLPFSEACQVAQTSWGAGVSAEHLAELARRLPVRTRVSVHSIEDEGVAEPVAPEDASSPLAQLEAHDTLARCQSAIETALAGLLAEDRVVLRLRFEDGLTVAEIARGLGLDQKKLYRRLETSLAGLRSALERSGVGWFEVAELIERHQCHLSLGGGAAAETPGPRPSTLGAIP